MSVDDRRSMISKSLESGALFYIVKPVNQKDLKNVIQCAVASKKGKLVLPVEEVMRSIEDGHSSSSNDHIKKAGGFDEVNSSPMSSENQEKNKKKGKKRERDGEVEKEDAPAPSKKAKVVWTNSLHNRFLQAIDHIGLEKAVPKRILEFMGVPGLTRENVASHLQKYRMFLKKVAERGLWSSQLSEKAFRSSFASGFHFSLFTKAHRDYVKQTFRPGFGGADNFSDFSSSSNLGFSHHYNYQPSTINSLPHFRYGQSNLLFGQSPYPFNLSNNSGTTLSFNRASSNHGPQQNQGIMRSRSNLFNNFESSNFGSASGSTAVPSFDSKCNYAGIRLTSDGEIFGSGQVPFKGKDLNSSSGFMNMSSGNGVAPSSLSRFGNGHENPFSSAAFNNNNNQENASQQQTNNNVGKENSFDSANFNFENINFNNQEKEVLQGEGAEELGALLFGSTQQQAVDGTPNVNPHHVQLSSTTNEAFNSQFSTACTLADKAPWTESFSQVQAQINNMNSTEFEPNAMRLHDNATLLENQGWEDDFLDFLLGNEPNPTIQAMSCMN